MREALRQEVDQNYDFFQRNLSGLMENHAGQYALLKAREIVAYFDGPGDAYRAGIARYPDSVFSIQQVTTDVDELGFMSIAVA